MELINPVQHFSVDNNLKGITSVQKVKGAIQIAKAVIARERSPRVIW